MDRALVDIFNNVQQTIRNSQTVDASPLQAKTRITTQATAVGNTHLKYAS